MSEQRAKIAELSGSQLEKVRALEKELGTWIVALEPQHQLAKLSEEQLKRLQAVEKELSLILLAYHPT